MIKHLTVTILIIVSIVTLSLSSCVSLYEVQYIGIKNEKSELVTDHIYAYSYSEAVNKVMHKKWRNKYPIVRVINCSIIK